MAQQTINIGTAANDGTGDAIRDAFDKVNDNFTELYPDLHVNKVGYFNYSDLATATTPISITGGAGFISLTNDGLGAQTLKTYAPTGITDVWNAGGGVFDWTELSLGDMINIRFTATVVTTVVNTGIDIELFLGSGGGAYTIPFITSANFKAAGTYNLIRFNALHMGNADTLASGGVFKMKADQNCTIKIGGWYLQIIRR